MTQPTFGVLGLVDVSCVVTHSSARAPCDEGGCDASLEATPRLGRDPAYITVDRPGE